MHEKKTRKRILFANPAPLRGEKIHIYCLATLILVLSPIVGVVTMKSGQESALYNSLSRIAYDEGHLGLVYYCGVLHALIFPYGQALAMQKTGYTKLAQAVLLSLSCLMVVTIGVGLGFPCYFDNDPQTVLFRTWHIRLTMIGFIGEYVSLLIYTITLWFRNRKLALLVTMFDFFTVIAGLFALKNITDPTSFVVVSSPTQLFLFFCYNLTISIAFYGTFIFPSESLAEK